MKSKFNREDKEQVYVYDRLAKEINLVSFATQFNTEYSYIKIAYTDTEEIEVFRDFEDFIYDLSKYYRNRIDIAETTLKKVEIADRFLLELHKYLTDYVGYVKDKKKFNTTIALYIKQFEFFRKQVSTYKDADISSNKKQTLTINEKIIILDYLGLLETVNRESTQEKRAKLLSLLLGNSYDNIRSAIRNVTGKPLKKGMVKNETTLENVLNVLTECGFDSLKSKAKLDLDKIN